jgi:hypothetical protein
MGAAQALGIAVLLRIAHDFLVFVRLRIPLLSSSSVDKTYDVERMKNSKGEFQKFFRCSASDIFSESD